MLRNSDVQLGNQEVLLNLSVSKENSRCARVVYNDRKNQKLNLTLIVGREELKGCLLEGDSGLFEVDADKLFVHRLNTHRLDEDFDFEGTTIMETFLEEVVYCKSVTEVVGITDLSTANVHIIPS